MKTVKNRSTRILLFASAFVLLVAVALLWLIMIRETERKDLLLEYEAFRASSAIVDEYRLDQSFTPEGDKRILGFGFYQLDGSAIKQYGSAPHTVAIPDELFSEKPGTRAGGMPGSVSAVFSPDRKKISLLRFSGLQNPGRMMGQGGPGFGMGMGRNRLNSQVAPLSPPQSFLGGQGQAFGLDSPHFVWIEYSSDGYRDERTQFFMVAAIITIALVGLYLLLIRVFRHNETLQTREMETRELVQLGEAARTLVHEIKNPLGIMRIQTAKIRRAASAPEAGLSGSGFLESSDIIEGEILRLSGLADRIREFLKPGPARQEPLDLVPFLRDFGGRYRDLPDSGISLSLEIPSETEAIVLADEEKLVIVLDNLVRNAMEAVEQVPLGQRRIVLRLSSREGGWALTVIDSGSGIAAETERRLFDPFFTTKEKGTGIGLALSRRLVESFGGTLGYEGGEKGGGAVFVVLLQAGKKAKPASDSTPA
jgi:signal transduction histidine kinase